jgi:hypothetical protein
MRFVQSRSGLWGRMSSMIVDRPGKGTPFKKVLGIETAALIPPPF